MRHQLSPAAVCSLCACLLTLTATLPAFAAGGYYDGSNPQKGGYHTGATDPADNNWLTDKTGGESLPINSDSDFRDIGAWQISAQNSRLNYYREDVPDDPDESWTLFTRFRVLNNNTPISANIVAVVDYGFADSTPGHRYLFRAGSNGNGVTLLQFPGVNSTFGAGGTQDGHTDYVTVAMAYDGTGIDVFINDIRGPSELRDLPSIPSPLWNRIQFGDGQTDDVSGNSPISRWTEVLYSVGPQACRDGIDNDGDGVTDFAGGDTDCSSANDPTEGDSAQTLASWGNNGPNRRVGGTLGGTAILAVSNGGGHSVALKANGQLVAWGDNDDGQASPPATTNFIAVAAGGSHSLALDADGYVTGWGNNANDRATPPNEQFTAITAGSNHNLGLKDDGSVIGWGLNDNGQTTVSSGVFTAIDAGNDYSLGLKTDGSITCWGAPAFCDHPLPSGNNFTKIAAGHNHALALKQDGTIVSWGVDPGTPPGGNNYIAIAAGDDYSLALTNDGSLAQWGSTTFILPAGDDFVAITAGDQHSTAIRGTPAVETPLASCFNATPTPGAPAGHYAVFNRESLNSAIACYNQATTDITINFDSEDLSISGSPDFPVNNSGAARLFIMGNNANVGLSGVVRFLTIKAGNVEVSDITVYRESPNSVSDSNGGAIYNAGTLSIRDTTLHSHNTNESGGAIVNASGASLTVLNTTLRNNSASSGGAIENSGILTVVNSTLSGNRSNLSGSALLNASGASATFYNSTLFGNPAGVMLPNQPSGAINNTGELTLKNTIIDNGQAMGVSCLDFSEGQLIADNHNLVTDGCGSATVLPSISIGLDPLRNNGGVTETHALTVSSQAVNAGDDTVCHAEPVNGIDQLGRSRAEGLTACDIGAYEVPGPSIESQQVATVTENQPVGIDLDVEMEGGAGDDGVTYEFSTANGGGGDNGQFTLDEATGIVTFRLGPDFETPGDTDSDNRYSVQVNVIDAVYGVDRIVDIVIVVTDDAADNCSPTEHRRSIASLNTWHLLTLPCELPAGAEFADLFGDQVLLDDEWSAFTYDASRPGYERITATSPPPAAGTGFWFISTEPFELVVPAGSQKVAMVAADACGGDDCYRQTIDHQTGWNLLGNPATENLRYGQMLLSNESTSCTVESPSTCSVADPEDMGVSSSIFVYNSFAGVYRSVDESVQQVVKPWDGYWTMFSYDGDLDSPWQLYSKDYPSQFVFVTDGSFTGNLGGVSGAHSKCRNEATAAGLPGRYLAWISDPGSPSSSFTKPSFPYVRIDGALIANSWNDLVNASQQRILDNPITTTATLQTVAAANVWTGTTATGAREFFFDTRCGRWTNSDGDFGVGGVTSRVDARWTDLSQTSCTIPSRLYCFGQ